MINRMYDFSFFMNVQSVNTLRLKFLTLTKPATIRETDISPHNTVLNPS